jgi:hypothetical protein
MVYRGWTTSKNQKLHFVSSQFLVCKMYSSRNYCQLTVQILQNLGTARSFKLLPFSFPRSEPQFANVNARAKTLNPSVNAKGSRQYFENLVRNVWYFNAQGKAVGPAIPIPSIGEMFSSAEPSSHARSRPPW